MQERWAVGRSRSHQGLIRAASGPSVMDQQEEVAGAMVSRLKRVVAIDCVQALGSITVEVLNVTSPKQR